MDRALMLAVALLIGAGGGYLFGRSNNAVKVAWLEDEVKRYAEEAALQSAAQLERQQEAAELAEQVAAYELELANGSAHACVSDPVYDARLRRILQTGGQPAFE